MLLQNISLLYRVAADGEIQKRGAAMQNAALLEHAFIRIEGDTITEIGTMDASPATETDTIDCTGRIVLPGFVDSHTHLVFPQPREHEFAHRLQGLTYEEIARRGGGILNSAKALEGMSEEQLLADARLRLRDAMRTGTTTIEIKSGYGLSVEGEIKLLRVARRLQAEAPVRIRTTFLGAHAVPMTYRENRQAYIDLVCEEMLPRIAAEGLADFIDVFCEKIAFTPEETAHILQRGAQYGLPAKIHANQLDYSGGVQVGVAHGAYSVDHLEHCGEAEIEALRHTDTVPTLLPSCSFFLREPYPPARALMAADLPVALATDFNPGSSPGSSMPFVMSLACIQMRMLPEEALVAATLNGAFALRMSQTVGSLEVGKKADILLTKPLRSLALLPYSFAANPIDTVIIGGEIQ